MVKIGSHGTPSGNDANVRNEGESVGRHGTPSPSTHPAGTSAAALGQAGQTTRSFAKRAASAAFAGLNALADSPVTKRRRTAGPRRDSADAAIPAGSADTTTSASASQARALRPADIGARRRPIRSASLDDLRYRSDREAPTLSAIIGEDPARDLDTRFGSLQPVREKRVGAGIHPWERDAQGTPLTHGNRAFIGHAHAAFPRPGDAETNRTALRNAVDLEALKNGSKRYIWAVGKLGRVIIAEEQPISPEDGRTITGKAAAHAEPKYAGHPMLVGGGPARVSGELHYDATRDCLVVLDKSGRYSRYADRQNAQVENVAVALRDAFAGDGLDVVARKVTGKDSEPLKYPTLA